MKELLEAGRVVPVIDGCYPLSKTGEAFGHFEKEHARGKVIINIMPQHELRLVEKFYGGRIHESLYVNKIVVEVPF